MDTWKRESPSIYESMPFPKSVADEDSKANDSNLPAAEAPPLVTENEAQPLVAENFESAEENSEPIDKGDHDLKNSITSKTPDAEVTAPPTTSAKRVSSIGWRTVVIFGIMSFSTGLGLSAALFSKSSWDLQALHSAYESIAANLPKLGSAEGPPVARPAAAKTATSQTAETATSQTANELQSISAELSTLRQNVAELGSLRQDIKEVTSLRQEIRSLFSEIAQIRKAQEQLIRAEAESARKSELPRSRPSDRRAKPIRWPFGGP
jgi:Skp family chaperone for outer membrane proteins